MVSRRLFSSCWGPGAQPCAPETAGAAGSSKLRAGVRGGSLGGSLPSPAGPGLSAPSPSSLTKRSRPEAFPQAGSVCGGAPVGPVVGMVPRGAEVGVQDSRPLQKRWGGLCWWMGSVGLWGLLAPPDQDAYFPGVSPHPSLGTGAAWAERLPAAAGTRPGQAACTHTLHFISVSRKKQQQPTTKPTENQTTNKNYCSQRGVP